MAGFMFWGAERLERAFGPRTASAAPRGRLWSPAMRGGAVAMVVFLVLAFALPFVGQPTVEERIAALDAETAPVLERREVQIEPVELLGLMHNHVQGSLGRFRLVVLDVRDESAFNLFHLVDARHATLDALKREAPDVLLGRDRETAIVVLASQDEARAVEAWKILHARGIGNAYVLAGGIDRWLDTFGRGRPPFDAALGDRYPFARPSLPVFQALLEARGADARWKVEPVVKAAAPTGGCG
jgi:rhodanese-related sulfurtransferase